MTHPIRITAAGRWPDLLFAAGMSPRFLTGRHSPCPMCGGTDRFRFDDKNGTGTWICSNCGAGDGVQLLMKFREIEFAEAAEFIEGQVGQLSPNHDHVEAVRRDFSEQARKLWDDAAEATRQSHVGLYLAARGLGMAHYPSALRSSSGILYLDDSGDFLGRKPAMLALVHDADNMMVAVHRTYLASDGCDKALVPQPRKLLGSLPAGSAVQLSGVQEVLGVAEGIETAMSAAELFDVPVWAALNANGLEKWTPHSAVRHVHIFGDNDENYRGQLAAFTLAHRLRQSGMEVTVRIPDLPGADWNDVLRGAK